MVEFMLCDQIHRDVKGYVTDLIRLHTIWSQVRAPVQECVQAPVHFQVRNQLWDHSLDQTWEDLTW